MYRYRVIEIENLEPLKIGARGSQSTYAEPSKDYIPGSTIRGAIIGELKRLGLFNEATKKAYLLDIEFYNAYPYVVDTIYLPTPKHLRADKQKWREAKQGSDNNNIKLTNLLLGNGTGEIGKNHLKYSFLAVEDKMLIGLNTKKEYRLHHSISKVNPANEKGKENLFRYEAITAQQKFRAIIKYKDDLEIGINKLLQKELTLYLGGSKGSGYGKSVITTIGESFVTYTDAKQELGIKFVSHSSSTNELIITCLSDCIFRDEYGQPINHISEKLLQELTGKEFVLDTQKQFIQAGQTEGYNATWKARYPKETTLIAGSVLKYTLNKAMSSDEVEIIADKLEAKPIGCRTQDGYGWIGINIEYPSQLRIIDINPIQRKSEGAKLDEILKNDKAKKTFNTIVCGMEDAKQRWLNMICNKYLNNDNREFIISDKLNNNRLKYMEDIINNWLEHEIIEEETIKRPYTENNELLSISSNSFKLICEYLKNGNSDTLNKFAENKLNSNHAKLYYYQHYSKDNNRRFIAELLMTGLYIVRRRCNHELSTQ